MTERMERDVRTIKQILIGIGVAVCLVTIGWLTVQNRQDQKRQDAEIAKATKTAHATAVSACNSLRSDLSDPHTPEATRRDVQQICKDAGVDVSADIAKLGTSHK